VRLRIRAQAKRHSRLSQGALGYPIKVFAGMTLESVGLKCMEHIHLTSRNGYKPSEERKRELRPLYTRRMLCATIIRPLTSRRSSTHTPTLVDLNMSGDPLESLGMQTRPRWPREQQGNHA
jgi:hypothetical protein